MMEWLRLIAAVIGGSLLGYCLARVIIASWDVRAIRRMLEERRD